MSSYQNSHIFSQGGDLSQLTCGFTPDQDSGTKEVHNIPEAEFLQGQNETMSSRAEAICEENRQINRFVELSLKQLEKKRINLINRENALHEEKTKLLIIQKRQSEKNVELQMNIEEWGMKYINELKQRKPLVEKLKQVEDFLSLFEQNLAKGIAVGEEVEESKSWFSAEFDKIKNKSKATRENMIKMRSFVAAELKKKAEKCKDLNDVMMKDREIVVSEIQSLVFRNDEMLNKITEIQEEIEKTTQNKEALTQSYNSISMEHKVLNESITKIYQDINEARSVNASDIQQLKLQMNTEENNNRYLESNLKEKESSIHCLATKLNESTNLTNQMKGAVDETQNHIEEKVKELDLYKKRELLLSKQVCSLVENLKKFENIEVENQHLKNTISSLEEELKLNINILKEKEDILHKRGIQVKGMENKLDILKESKSKLEEELANAHMIENKLTSDIKENSIQCELESEKKLLEIETLKQRNEEVASEITKDTMNLENLCFFNKNATKKVEEMENVIENCQETARINEEKFLRDEEEQMELVNTFNEKINQIKNELEKYEYFIVEAKPQQKELSIMLEKKESLEQEVKLLTENHQKKINLLENNHKAKIQGMDSEMENHSSIMKTIQTAEEESTDKLKGEIKEEEKVKTRLETELRVLHQTLKNLKIEEVMKRNKIAKMEKRQQTIMKEIKVTREDIAQAVSGNVQAPQPLPFKRPRLMTPSSSDDSRNSLHGKVSKRVEDKNMTIMAAPASKQESTRKWLESVPVDEYEFSEI